MTCLASCAPQSNGTTSSVFQRASSELRSTRDLCANGPVDGPYAPPQLSEEDRARAEWDIAAAESIPNVSVEQEWEIRSSLASEMGLAPSQVNGWRDIYRARAEQARRLIEQAEQPTPQEVLEYKARIKQDACSKLPSVEEKFERISREFAFAERQQNSYEINLKILVGLLIFGIIGAIVFWIERDRHRREKGQAALKQVYLDGQLQIGLIYKERMEDEEWAAIVTAHSEGDLKKLQSLVNRAQELKPPSYRSQYPDRPARRPLNE